MNKQFSPREIIAIAWAIAKKNAWVIMDFTSVQFITIMITTILLKIVGSGMISLALNILLVLVNSFLSVVIYRVFFNLIDEERDNSFPDIMPSIVKALNFILVQVIVYAVAILLIASIAGIYFYNAAEIDPISFMNWKSAALLLGISLPVLYASVRMSFVLCFIVDQSSTATEAISQSWMVTKGHFWLLFVLILAIIGINMLGAMAFFVGLLFSVPLSSLIIVVAYRQIINSYYGDDEHLLENTADGSESITE